MSMRLASPLSAALEIIVQRTIGCLIEVHRRLGPGYLEGLYEDAVTIELEHQRLAFERQREVVVLYRERPLRPQRIDLVVENQLVVEIKAVEQLHPIHRAQLMSYLRASGLQIGLLANFNCSVLKDGLKRVVV